MVVSAVVAVEQEAVKKPKESFCAHHLSKMRLDLIVVAEQRSVDSDRFEKETAEDLHSSRKQHFADTKHSNRSLCWQQQLLYCLPQMSDLNHCQNVTGAYDANVSHRGRGYRFDHDATVLCCHVSEANANDVDSDHVNANVNVNANLIANDLLNEIYVYYEAYLI